MSDRHIECPTGRKITDVEFVGIAPFSNHDQNYTYENSHSNQLRPLGFDYCGNSSIIYELNKISADDAETPEYEKGDHVNCQGHVYEKELKDEWSKKCTG